MYEEDKVRMVNFIRSVYGWLGALYVRESKEIAGSGWPLVIDNATAEIVDLRAAAWIDFANDHSLSGIISRIENMDDEAITNHGLYGAQLTLKLGEVMRQAERVMKAIAKQVVRGFQKFVEVVDILLESIADAAALPGALIEIKELLKLWRGLRPA